MSKKTSRIFTLVGLALCLLTLWITFANLDSVPVMLKTPKGATQNVESLMDALCTGDYETVRAHLYGNPDLGLNQQPQTEAARLIQPLYRESLSYEILHDPCVSDSGLSVCVAVASLDASRLAEMLAQKVMELPEDAAALPESWNQALAEIPQMSYPQTTHTITLNLANAEGQWWILPEKPLLQVISGTME